MNKRTWNAAFYLLIVLGVIALGIFVFKALNRPHDKKDEATPTVKPIVYMSTDGVIENIERKLGDKTGVKIEARCPKKVNKAEGTKFRCSVRYAGREKRIAIAHVVIDGPTGDFSWKSDPLKKSKPTT